MDLSRRDFSFGGLASAIVPLALPATSACSRPLRASQNDGSYQSTLVNGLTPERIMWNGRQWRCDMGSTWNRGMDYCLRVTPDKARFELRNTPNDRGNGDPAHKRRSELHYAKRPRLPNDVPLWGAMSFIHHRWDDPAGMASLEGGVHGQIHIGSSFGGSPAVAFRRRGNGIFRITTRGENDTDNTVRYDGPLAFDEAHDLVYRVVLSPTSGSLVVWLNRQKILDLQNASIGSHFAECYWNIGCYYGGGVACPVVAEYANHVYPDTASLESRVSAGPRWPAS